MPKSDQYRRYAQACLLLARDAEDHEHHAAIGHDVVLWLDVAVDDVLLVDVVQRLARLAAPLDDVVDRQPRRALGGEPIVQAFMMRRKRLLLPWMRYGRTRG